MGLKTTAEKRWRGCIQDEFTDTQLSSFILFIYSYRLLKWEFSKKGKSAGNLDSGVNHERNSFDSHFHTLLPIDVFTYHNAFENHTINVYICLVREALWLNRSSVFTNTVRKTISTLHMHSVLCMFHSPDILYEVNSVALQSCSSHPSIISEKFRASPH